LVSGGDEPGLLPCGKLAGPQMQNAQYVLTAVSGHRGLDRNRCVLPENEYASQGRVLQGFAGLFA
jgi:hypothetical protein